MQRRLFLKSALAGGALVATPRIATAQSPRMTIKRVRFYHSPNPRPIFNQSTHVVEVETDQGIRAKQLFFCNLTESDLRSDSPVV